MSGPSAIGSENGMPISIAAAPAASSSRSSSRVTGSDGYPAVTKGISAVGRARSRMPAVKRLTRDDAGSGLPGQGRERVALELQRRADVLILDLEERRRAGL